MGPNTPREAWATAVSLVLIIPERRGLAHITPSFGCWAQGGLPGGLCQGFQGHKGNPGRSEQLFSQVQTLRNLLNVKHLLSFSHRTPGVPRSARRKAPHAISSNKENYAQEIEFSADLFNLVISEHLVLAATGEWAASRRFISRFLKISIGLLNQHESLSCLPHKHESRIIKTQGKHVTP